MVEKLILKKYKNINQIYTKKKMIKLKKKTLKK